MNDQVKTEQEWWQKCQNCGKDTPEEKMISWRSEKGESESMCDICFKEAFPDEEGFPEDVDFPEK